MPPSRSIYLPPGDVQMPTELKVTLSISYDNYGRTFLRVWVMDTNGNQAEGTIDLQDLREALYP